MRTGLKRAAAAIGRPFARQGQSGIRVLCYHRVGAGTDLQMDLSREMFEQQLQELRHRGPIISLDDALRAVASGVAMNASVITFDDGYLDAFENAVPLLHRHGLPAHFYLSTALITEGTIPTAAGPAAAVNVATLRAFRGDPLLSFGTHGQTHRVLTRLPDDEVLDELRGSRDRVQEWTGSDAGHFAYPKALWDRRVEALVRTVCQSAAIGGSRLLVAGSDLFRIRRFPIQQSDDLALFRAKLDGALILEDAARSARDRLRRARGREPER